MLWKENFSNLFAEQGKGTDKGTNSYFNLSLFG